MFISMTGYGRASKTLKGKELVLEIKSVNHKGCEVSTRTANELSSMEPRIIQAIKSRVERGRVDVTAYFMKGNNTPESRPARVSLETIAAYQVEFKKIGKKLNLEPPTELEDYLGLPGVIVQESGNSQESPVSWADVEPLVNKALDGLIDMRKKEGTKLGKDISARIKNLEQLSKDLRKLAPLAQKERLSDLHRDLEKLLKNSPAKCETPQVTSIAANFLESTDVTEELVRVESHIAQFKQAVKSTSQLGRKLDFIFQELFREFNTIGSKTSHPDMGQKVVEAKTELDKMKQQIANIE